MEDMLYEENLAKHDSTPEVDSGKLAPNSGMGLKVSLPQLFFICGEYRNSLLQRDQGHVEKIRVTSAGWLYNRSTAT
jgi:hypothetical protein